MKYMIKFIFVIGLLLAGFAPVSDRRYVSVPDSPPSPETLRKVSDKRPANIEPLCPDYCTKDFLLGKINYRKDTVLFTKVDSEHTWNKVYLKKEVYEAFKKMYKAALEDGVKLVVISGCRTFNDQQCIWENKWKSEEYRAITNEKERARKILQYVAVPGTSRHHWGTEIDFNSAKLAYYAGPGKKVYEWLRKNASKFGFYQPYTPIGEGRPTGYHEEMWHWTYLPLSSVFLREYVKQIQPEDLAGFEGASVLYDMGIIEGWVLGINPDCKPLSENRKLTINN